MHTLLRTRVSRVRSVLSTSCTDLARLRTAGAPTAVILVGDLLLDHDLSAVWKFRNENAWPTFWETLQSLY